MFWVIFVGIIFLSACSGQAENNNEQVAGENVNNEQEVTITFSHNQSVASTEHLGAEKFKEVIEEESEGKVKVDIYPSSQLGALREQVESTQIGEIDITMQPAAVITPFEDDVKIIDLPYLWPTESEKMYEVLDSEAGLEILNTVGDAGLKGLGFWPGGYKIMTTSNTLVKEPEDIEGLTMRIMESPVLVDQFKHWGGNAIPVAYSEVYNALQLGIVDGQENPIQTVYMNKYYEVQNNIIESYHGSMTYMLVANQDWYEALAPEIQEMIKHAEQEARTASRDALAEVEDEYRQEIKESTENYYQFTEEDITEFRKVTEPLWEEVYNTPKQQEILKSVRAEIEKMEIN